MYAKKGETMSPRRSPRKLQTPITKYITYTTNRISKPNLDWNASTSTISYTMTKVNFKKKPVTPPKIGNLKLKTNEGENKSPILENWLKNNQSGMSKMLKFNYSFNNDNSFDEKEEEKQLKKIKYYRQRIAKYEERARIILELEELEKNLPVYSPKLYSSPEKFPKLDCYNMTRDDIKQAFKEHLNYLKNITNESIYSERHETFKMERNILSESSLCSNVAMNAFTKQQLMWLSKLLNKYFGDCIDYQMKVLLPELLLKIFMNMYNMSEIEAYHYLNNM